MKTNITLIIFFLCFGFVYGETYNIYNDDYYRVIYDNVALREVPSMQSKVISRLRITQKLRKINMQNRMVRGKNFSNRWIFVTTETFYSSPRDMIKGWIMEKDLAKRGDFLRLNSIKCNMVLRTFEGDFGFTYYFNKNGTYKILTQGEEGKSIGFGELFFFKNLVIPKGKSYKNKDMPSLGIMNVLYINSYGIICRVGGGYDGKDQCAVCIK